MKIFWQRLMAMMVAGLAISVMLAPVVASPVGAVCNGQFTIDNGIECAAPSGTDTSRKLDGTKGIFVGVINTIIAVIGALAILMIVIGGLRYVLSGGDAKGVENAKNSILYSVIGLVVAIGAYAIVQAVLGKFK